MPYTASSEHKSAKTSQPGSGADWKAHWAPHSEFNVTDILDNFATEYPQWADPGFVAEVVSNSGRWERAEPTPARIVPNSATNPSLLDRHSEAG